MSRRVESTVLGGTSKRSGSIPVEPEDPRDCIIACVDRL